MGIIELALVAIKGLSVVLNNPALGGGSSVKMQEASELLALLGELLTRGDAAHDELVAFTKTVEEMAAQGRAPTTAEWATLRQRSDAAHAIIQEAAAAAAEPEPEVVDPVTAEPITSTTKKKTKKKASKKTSS
jgi:hypothetical protein